MKIPSIDELNLSSGSRVLVRADVDVGETLEPGDDIKLSTNIGTLKYLLEKNTKVIIVGHRGRPKGQKNEKLSLLEVSVRLGELLETEPIFCADIYSTDLREKISELQQKHILFLENIRFDPGEEENSDALAKHLASLADFYVNEAFSASAKEHASIVGVPKLLPHAAGLHFQEEVDSLSKVLDNPGRPVVVIISGVKKDKLDYLEDFKKFADKVLIAGRLPEFLPEDLHDDKLVVAQLLPDKEDITMHSIEAFEKEIANAGTIVVGGPVGKFEDAGHRQGTDRVFRAVADSGAFKVAGGGDTQQAIELLDLCEKFDWISVGGGASLEFLAKGTLPGIEALID